MANERSLISAFFFKLFFSAVFCIFFSGMVFAQAYDASIFVVNTAVSPSAVVQAWAATPVQFMVEDVFFSKTLGRYLGQTVDESFAVTANLLSGNTVVYREGVGVVTFSHGYFSFILGKKTPLMPSVLGSPNLILRLDLPSQTATFSISSLPYAIHTRVAEKGLSGLASVVSGNFVSTFSVQTGLFVTQNKLVVRGSRVGFGTFSPAYTVDVAGVANFSDMYLNGAKLSETLSWRQSSLNTANIYTVKPQVGIRTAFPSSAFALHVAATVNATNLTRNGNPISASNFWVQTVVPTYNLYILDHNVGIGTAVPKSLLDVNGAVRMDTTSSGNTGTIRWAAVDAIKDFQGYVDALENGVPTQTWRSLTGIYGSGRADRVTRWLGSVSPPKLDYVSDLIHKAGRGLGLGVSPTARLHVVGKSLDTGPVFLVSSSANVPLINISPTGGVGIGTTLAGNRLEVVGTVNAQDLLIDGVPLRLTLSRGTYWLRNDKNSLYYLHGNVGIGRPDPTSLFEIAAPNHAPGEPTKNPALTFTAKKGLSDQQQYTLGINAQTDGVFRVEKGISLGSETPLFVALDDRFGVGLSNPKANLHVSGNTGLILTGLYEALDPGVKALTATVSVTGPGTRMVFHPSKGIFRVGYLSGTGIYQGAQWNNEYLGIDTTAFGKEHLVSGNRSHAVGGDAHRIGGAYATVVGGQGNQAYGDFAVAMGRGAAANHHGTFVWGDGVGGTFSSVTENQFLIRAAAGVGINTSQTGISVQFSTRNVSLAVSPKPVGAVHFLGLLSDPSDWASAQSIVDALTTQGYLLSSGEMAPSFNPLAVLSFPSGFAYGRLADQIREVLNLHSQGFVLDFEGRNSKAFIYTQQGGVGVNTLTPAANSLTVMNTVFINATGNAGLFVQNTTSKREPMFLTVGTQNPTTSPSFVVVSSGNVGIGKFPDLLANGSPVSGSVPVYGYLESSGAIVADEFVFPDGQGLSATASVLVWSFVNTTPNIYFPSSNMGANGRLTNAGNVGIGTTSPNSLLEISNRSSLLGFTGAVSPVITFDLDGTDRYTMGVSHTENDVFRIGTGGSVGAGSAFAVLDNRVGIAITRPLAAALSVGGTGLLSRLKIGTANLNATTNLSVYSLNSTQFIVNNELIGWLSVSQNNTTNIFHDTAYSPNSIPPVYSFVGIGTTVPRYELDVAGTLNIRATTPDTPSIFMRNFIIDGDYYADKLNLRDVPAGSEPSLLVTNEDLILDPHTGTVNINISKVFTRGEGAGGYVGMWSTDAGVSTFSILAQTNMYWTSPTASEAGVLLVTANTAVSKYVAFSDSFSASNNINIGSSDLGVMLTAKSVISHDGILAHSRSHDAVSMNVLIQSWPEQGVDWVTYPDSPIPLMGLFIHMRNRPYENAATYFSGGARAIGLNVDMSGVNLQKFTDEGYRFPAIFMGSSEMVGIGGTPNATLDVYGTLRAQTFHISNGLSISTINVLNAIYIDQPGLVGFGTNSPRRALDLAGSIQSIGMVAPVTATNLSAGGGNLTVGTNGYVGIGTSAPVAQWELQKQFSSLPSSDFTFQTVDATVTDNLVTQPLYGIKVAMSTLSGSNYANKLGDLFNVKKVVGTGYKVDLSGLDVPTGGRVVGVSSVVSTNRDSDRKAAIFMGGNVGIGTTTPLYPLEVAGTIYATNAPAANFLTQQEIASFSVLNIANSIVIKKGAQFWDLTVATLNQKELRLVGTLSIPDQRLVVNNQMVVQSLVSLNETITVNSLVALGSAALQSVSVNKMAVGGALTSEALRVYGDMVSTQLSVDAGTLQSSLFSVNDTALLLTDTGRLGIGTSSPGSSKVHIKTNPYQIGASVVAMDPADYRTWNPMILQGAGATSGNAVGVVFVPDYDTSGHSGSGIVAVKTSDTTTSSALAFITDPEGEDAYPQERLRITDYGWVGIGTTAPGALLDVNGTLTATNLTFPTSGLFVHDMTGATVTFSVTTNVVSFVEMDRLRLSHLDFVPTAAPAITSDNGKLFVNSASNHLFYGVAKNGETILGNLTVTASVLPDALAYFDAGRSMAGASLMKWVTENSVGILRISSENEISYVTGSRFLVTGVVSQNNLANAVLHRVNLGFQDRTAPGTARFSGMDIVMGGSGFGSSDRLTGLSVTVSNTLRTTTTLSGGSVVSGRVVAAAFLVGTESSGNVAISSGVESEKDIIPSASLHIFAKRSNHVPLWVQTTVNAVLVNSLFVSPNTAVGIGTSVPTSRLSVRSQSASDASLHLASFSGASVLAVTDSGLGIGVSQPSTALSVLGGVSANSTVFGGLQSGTLSVNTQNSGLMVSSLGEVMIGTTLPLGQFTMRRQFTTPSAVPTDFFMQDILQTIGTGNTATVVTRNITGVAVVVSTDASSTFEGTSGSNLVMGMNLDLKSLVAVTGNPIVGTYVNTGLSGTQGAGRYAATFLGGNVGIGVTQPTVAVDILGDIRARNLISSGNWTLSSVTTDILAAGSASITTLDIRSATPLSLEVTNELWVGAAATVNIEGGTYDTNLFRTVALNALLGTANRVFVGYNTSDSDVFDYVTQIAADFPSNPSLGVKGNGRLDALTVPTVNIGSGIFAGTLSINSPVAITANRVSQSGSVVMRSLYMRPTSNVSGVALFVQSNGSLASPLVFRPSASSTATIDMSSVSKGLANRVVGYNSLGRISDTPFLRYTDTQSSGVTYSVLSVGTVNATITSGNAALGLYSGYGTATGLGNVYGSRVSVGVGPRVTGTSASFSGVSVGQASVQKVGGGEVFGGLYVDMDDSLKVSTVFPNPDSPDAIGTKIAAIFRAGSQTSGNVGIHTDEALSGAFWPSADLHVVSVTPNPLWVQASGRTAIGSDGSGWISIGHEAPSANLSVVGYSDTEALSLIAGTTQVMVAGNSGIGIGQLPNSAAWSVAGSVSANSGIFNGLQATTLQVGSSVVVNSLGYMGIGTLTPDTSLTMAKLFALPADLSSNYRQRVVSMSIATAATDNMHSPLIGYGIQIDTDSSSQFGTGTTQVDAIGMSVNLKDLQATTNGRVNGIYADVSGATGSRYGAVFMGGNVGIGTTTPATALQISGSMTGVNAVAIAQVSINATAATVNSLALLSGANFVNMSVTTNGVDVVVLGTLRFANTSGVTVNFQDNLSTNKVWTSQGIVADVATFNALFVSAKPSDWVTPPALWVSANALLHNNLTLSPLMDSRLYVGSLTSTRDMFFPSVQVGSGVSLNVKGNLGVNVAYLSTIFTTAVNTGSEWGSSFAVHNFRQGGNASTIPDYKYGTRSIWLGNMFKEYVGDVTTLNMAMYGTELISGTSLGIITSNTTLSLKPNTPSGNHIAVMVASMNTNLDYALRITSSLNTTALTSDYNANNVNILFGDRSTAGSSKFIGADIFLSGNTPLFETAVGVSVNLTQLYSESSTQLPLNEDSAVDGFKSSAVFLAENNGDTQGTLGVFTFDKNNVSGYATPNATLHVGNTATGNAGPFLIGTTATANTLIVTSLNAGIWVASSDVQLRTTGLLVHATGTNALKLNTAAGSPILTALQTGSVGIGTTQMSASLNIVHGESTGYAFWMNNPVTSNPFVMTGSGTVGLGNTNPTSMLDMTFDQTKYTFPVPVEWSIVEIHNDGCAGSSGNSGRPEVIGRYLIGGVSYFTPTVRSPATECLSLSTYSAGQVVEAAAVGLSSYPTLAAGFSPLRINSPAGVALSMGQTGKLGIWRAAPTENYMSMAVAGAVVAGDTTGTTLPWTLPETATTYPIGYGYAVSQSGDFAFLGHYRESAVVSANGVLMWGKDAGDVLSVKDLSQTELLHFVKVSGGGPRLGVATSDPKGTLSIGATAITQYPFRLDTSATLNSLLVDTAGNVGFGTGIPSKNLHVMGNFNVGTSTLGGLNAGTVTTNYMTLGKLGLGVLYETPPEFKSTLPIQHVGMTLSVYSTTNITGVSYSLTSGNAYKSTLVNANTAAVKVTGLLVNVNDLSTEEFSGNSNGYKAAAVFNGGTMLIGHHKISGSSVISTASIPLEVYAMNLDGNSVSTGDILKVESTYTKSGIVTKGPRIFLNYMGNQNLYHEVTPLAFTASQDVDDDASAAKADITRLAADIVVSTNRGVGVYLTKSSGSIGASDVNVNDILSQAKTKATAVFHVQRDGGADSMIQLLSGQNASTVTTSMVSAVGVGYVGFGLTSSNVDLAAIDRPLVVSGDVQVGVTRNSFFTGSADWGDKVYFSGGRVYAPGGNSDNTHEYFMGRYNVSSTLSELRLNIGETSTTSPNPSSKLIIDSYPVGSPSIATNLIRWGEQSYLATGFSVSVFGYVDPSDATVKTDLPVHAGVGIGTTSPVAGLHVVGRSTPPYLPETPTYNTVLIASSGNQNLALVNYGTATDANFMTFLHKDTAQVGVVAGYAPAILGAIEMDGFGGVQFASPEADYAEYLPKLSGETFLPGEVVGVFNGKISRSTAGARSIRVISSRPIVSGSFPGSAHLDAFGLVAFMGQVSVKVRGPVRAGDYLIPSGRQDGTAVAIVASSVVQPEQIIGQAWSSSELKGESHVNAVVGLSFANKHVGERLGEVIALRDEVSAIKSDMSKLKAYLQTKYEEREAKIALLKKR